VQKPRLIYYTDGHHFHAKRIEPPASIHMLQWPADEVAGTGVDLLVLGLGYGDVYFHNSKAGRVVGDKKEVWENYIDWRIMRMVEEGKKLGTDQLREVIKHGRDLGITVFPSLKLQDSAKQGDERCGWLKWNKGAEVCIGEGKLQWNYDFARQDVRDDKLAIAREVLEDYGADGLELDFEFGGALFKPSEAVKNTGLMNDYVAQFRKLAKEIGKKQKREIKLMARIEADRENNLAKGIDVEAWFKQGSIDWVVGQDRAVLTDPGVQAKWLPDIANAHGGAAYFRPPRRVYDERVGLPAIEHYRALGANLKAQGYSGQYHGYLPWPFAEREYQILRELAYPEMFARRDKAFTTQPKEGEAGKPTTTPHRQVPAVLKEGETVCVDLTVSDDFASARRDGEMRKPVLTLRYAFYCIEDDIEVRINGRPLKKADAEITDERALQIPVQLAGGMSVQAPLGFSAHWFRWKLELDDVKTGSNRIEVQVKKTDKRAGFTRSLIGVEILTRFKDFVRPEAFDMHRVAPKSG